MACRQPNLLLSALGRQIEVIAGEAKAESKGGNMLPGEVLVDETAGPIAANVGRATVTLLVRHTGDRPIQVGSHYHFFEVNDGLDFDRTAAYGLRLNIAAVTAIRFEPGDAKEGRLVPLAGDRIAMGHRGLVLGALAEASTKGEVQEQGRSS